jgi:hypothetical protein
LYSAIKAIEAVGPKPKSRDKKIAFWTAYNTLAEEFDKEFREKYKDDLDTSLIFVCDNLELPVLYTNFFTGRAFLCCQLGVHHTDPT